MLVIAKQLGEYPQGRWRQPGEKFNYDVKDVDGKQKRPALWMMTVKEADEAQAKDKVKVEEDNEIIQAQAEARDKILAKRRAASDNTPEDDDEALALAKKVSEELKAKGIHAFHKGFGKWDVFGLDGTVAPDGVDLNKADAEALVKTLLADKAGA
ncbi:MAG: hypothetical protein JKX96_07815 [Acinetobacter sp.]|nr:hypothetical protein [Acinetobacter sp.]